ncbi:MAG TPA: asparaginase, partial [Candidatus Limnocylindrales bacterium]|nr:asparaginase [Candidatus Limnocylindrales bacterium]
MTTPDAPAPGPSPTRRRPATRSPSRAAGSSRSRIVPPILVRQVRNGIEESVHRGDIVEVDVDGRLIRGIGDPDRLVTLRSCVKPFGVTALIEAGGLEAFDLEPAEIAVMASSHSGEDLHVRTIQAMYR